MRALVVVVLVACGGDKSPPPAQGSGSSAGSAHVEVVVDAGPQIPLGPDGLPKVCGDWKAAIDKLQTCAAIPQNARDSLIAVYKDASSGWSQLPAEAKKNLASICSAGAHAVLDGAAATCGWR